jgi:hypothetical protein
MKKYCCQCGSVAHPKNITKGSILIEIGLWLVLVLPGVLYTVWRFTSKYEGCRVCGSHKVIPLTTPKANLMMSQHINMYPEFRSDYSVQQEAQS